MRRLTPRLRLRIGVGAVGLAVAAILIAVSGSDSGLPSMSLFIRGSGTEGESASGAAAEDRGQAEEAIEKPVESSAADDDEEPTAVGTPGATTTTLKTKPRRTNAQSDEPTPVTTAPKPTTTTTRPPRPETINSPDDYVPPYSVLDYYPTASYNGPTWQSDLRPWEEPVKQRSGATGYARTWLRPEGEGGGGYTVFAWTFPDEESATAAREEIYELFTGEWGADPVSIRQGVRAGWLELDVTTAYWVQNNYLRMVSLSTQNARDVEKAQAIADLRYVVKELISIDSRGCC